ncbi:autophagy-related protein 7, putative (ATG7) [Plasmodium ovale curtisi]|uniref:Autophagy-related protein 7, putative (ATG7) n=1 Tax=Plasmodium ovale curtisi TaxID=864141 RepID=A0A1A8VT38_PLAOA|nr:autophagy-related protein 7, putative (ATG7) [Plasmodium ovale curtisi]
MNMSNSTGKVFRGCDKEGTKCELLKHPVNEFKIDVSFFTKLHERKVSIYKLESDYIELLSSTYVNKIKVGSKFSTNGDLNIAQVEYPCVYISSVEINGKSFVLEETWIQEGDEDTTRAMTQGAVAPVWVEAHNDNANVGDDIPQDKNEKENALEETYTQQEKIKRNRYGRKYPGILLNFNTLHEFLNTRREEHINHCVDHLRVYLNENVSTKQGDQKGNENDGVKGDQKDGRKGDQKDGRKGDQKDGRKGDQKDGRKGDQKDGPKGDQKNDGGNIFEDNFWEYKEEKLHFFEKMNRYIILSYLDLKKCICYYSIANPVIKPRTDFYLSKLCERMFFYIDTQSVYINNERRKINIVDILYLSQLMDTYFFNYKMFVNSGIFLLLKCDGTHTNTNTTKWKFSGGEFYEKLLENMHYDCSNFQSEECKKFYKIKSFKELYDYLSEESNYTNSEKDEHEKILHNNCNIVILPINCLAELKEDIKNSKDKMLRNIKKNIFDLYICVVDTNYVFNSLSWDFRNFLYFFSLKYKLYNFQIDVLAFRDLSLLSDKLICSVDREKGLLWKCPNISSNCGNFSYLSPSFEEVSNIRLVDYRNVSSTNIDKFSTNRGHFFNEKDMSTVSYTSTSSTLIKYILNSTFLQVVIPDEASFMGNDTTLLSSEGNKKIKRELIKKEDTICTININPFLKNFLKSNKIGYDICYDIRYQIISGWKKYEKKINGIKKKSIIHITKLNDFLNKNTIHRISLELNIKLIKWKILKDLEFEKIKKLKILIIGLGTLGCMVARNCVSWGIRNFTFIDCSRVSYSNVSRQYLYTIDDVECNNNLGEYKCIAAKNHLLKISPDLHITAIIMDIPMPGHLHYLKDEPFLENTINELDELIDNHDVVFLLTDSKESRYFPCLLIAQKQYNCLNIIEKNPSCTEHKQTLCEMNSSEKESYTNEFIYRYYIDILEGGKIFEDTHLDRHLFYNNILENVKKLPKMPPLGITVAIGFDSFLVLRHPYLYFKAACYFCNDMHPPSDSLSYRTIDEKCTVSRCGISTISSSISTELLMSLTQHPFYFFAPHTEEDKYIYHDHGNITNYENVKETKKKETSNAFVSCLGATPHIITFNLANFTTKKLFCDAFEKCLCCSENVIRHYQQDKMGFIKNVISDSLILERITNIGELKGTEEHDVILLD